MTAYRAAAAALLAACLVAASPAAAQPAVLTAEEALARDAADYARVQGLSLEEALARLRAQEGSIAATYALEEEFRGRLTGISIEHRPQYRIVVSLTGTEPVRARFISAGGRPVPVVFTTHAGATREQLVAVIRRHADAIRAAFPPVQGMAADPRDGALLLMVKRDIDDPAAVIARIEALTGVPVRIRRLGLNESNASVEGGGRVDGLLPGTQRRAYCTTGFSVTDGARTGILTAAHCPDEVTWRDAAHGDVALEMVGSWGAQVHDVQVHVGAAEFRPYFFADTRRTELRAVAGARPRRSTRAGDIVCHRGESSGYSCAEVELVDYAPPYGLCGGHCEPVWVMVSGPGCRSGDSGGPVFIGNVALGLLKSTTAREDGSCEFYQYMSLDYMPEGWRLLTQ